MLSSWVTVNNLFRTSTSVLAEFNSGNLSNLLVKDALIISRKVSKHEFSIFNQIPNLFLLSILPDKE